MANERENTSPQETHVNPAVQPECSLKQTSVKIHAREQGFLGGLEVWNVPYCKKECLVVLAYFELEMPGGRRRIFRVSVFPEW